MVELYKTSQPRSIFAAQIFNPFGGVEMLPGEDVQSDDEILDYLRAEALTVYHPAGSCKMGMMTWLL